MPERGWKRLWVKSLDNPIFKNSTLWHLWTYVLLKATRKEFDQDVGFQKVHLMPGQLVFGRHQCQRDTGISEQTIRTGLKYLQVNDFLTIKVTNKYSIISVTNWAIYQPDTITTNHQSNQQVTSNQPTSNQQVTTKEKNRRTEEQIKEKDLCASDEPHEPEPPFYLTAKKKKLEGKHLESFNAFWEAWNFSTPWKKGQKEAADAWLAVPGLSPKLVKRICEAAKDMGRHRVLPVTKEDSTPIYPATWLNKGRWEDYEPEPTKPDPKDDPQEREYQEFLKLEAERAAHAQ